MHIQGVDSKCSTLQNTCRGSILYSNNGKGFVKQWGSNLVTTLCGELEGDKLQISMMWMSGHARGVTFTLQGLCWQPTRQCGMPHVQPYRFWWVLHPVCLVTAFLFPGVSGLLSLPLPPPLASPLLWPQIWQQPWELVGGSWLMHASSGVLTTGAGAVARLTWVASFVSSHRGSTMHQVT